MKKLFSAIFITFILLSFTHAVNPDKYFFSGGLSSGIPVYGNSGIKNTISSIDNSNRIIIGTFVHGNIAPMKYVTFFTGAELLSDFCWNSDYTTSLFHFDFPLGLKIYPQIGGLNFGLAYTLGFCGYMINSPEGNKNNGSSPWGNGFKIFTEFDFSRIGKSKYFPTLGIAWNCMPRGNKDYDNLIIFYIEEHF